jgi:hypothetical protein
MNNIKTKKSKRELVNLSDFKNYDVISSQIEDFWSFFEGKFPIEELTLNNFLLFKIYEKMQND